MDALRYVKGKGGDSRIERHGKTTILITMPGGFDPDTGAPKEPIQQGFQRADIAALVAAGNAAVAEAEKALAAAQAQRDAAKALLAEVDALK